MLSEHILVEFKRPDFRKAHSLVGVYKVSYWLFLVFKFHCRFAVGSFHSGVSADIERYFALFGFYSVSNFDGILFKSVFYRQNEIVRISLLCNGVGRQL